MSALRSFGSLASILCVAIGFAQPGGPDISFTLVSDAKGKPMPGLFAADMITRHDLGRQGVESWSVEEHFTSQSPYEPERNGEHISWILQGTITESNRIDARTRFSLASRCWICRF